ncbi:MAG: 6-phosphofructokinase [Deltaproteobacteria bacterium]|nr:MAG: 6-phosphofructokinase [Deltaproteobacteria bacterium]
MPGDRIRRVGIVFSGGPAPAANAVIAAAAISFLEDGREVIGFFHGFSNLVAWDPVDHRLVADEHYRRLTLADVRGIRNARGVLLGTSRVGPGAEVRTLDDLDDPARTGNLRRVLEALDAMEIDALVTIGGDGTLRAAWLLYEYQARLPEDSRRVAIVHLPKTIDNDYRGIDFTFGFFTAVDVMAKEVENLRADAAATSSWFIIETMGRKAGWLSYGVAIAGEADLVLAAEDVDPTLTIDGTASGALDLDRLAARIDLAVAAAEARGKHHGVVVLAEGLADRLPADIIAHAGRNEQGNLAQGTVDLARLVAARVTERHARRTGVRKRFKSLQLGYESRSAPPHAFDVMLGSQLGIGAYRALVEEGLDGFMVSVTGQLDLHYLPLHTLVDRTTTRTEIRYIRRDSDLYRLARFLEERTDRGPQWGPGRRRE